MLWYGKGIEWDKRNGFLSFRIIGRFLLLILSASFLLSRYISIPFEGDVANQPLGLVFHILGFQLRAQNSNDIIVCIVVLYEF